VLSNGSGVAEERKNDAGNRPFKYHILTLVLFRAHSSDQAVILLVRQIVGIHSCIGEDLPREITEIFNR